MKIKFTLDPGAYAPEKAHEADAGYDLRAAESGYLDECGGGEIIDTGVHIEIPKGYVGYIQGRSGLNFNEGIICPTGTIDSGYTGSIKVKLYSHSVYQRMIYRGEKIAQLIIQPIADTELVQVDRLEETERGNNGFGSTGR